MSGRKPALKRRIVVRVLLMAAALATLLGCNVAVAQVVSIVVPTPTIDATSPLSSVSGSPIGPTGIPLGATEITSAGTSPLPSNLTGTITIPGSGTACSTLGTTPSQMYESSASYDGCGMSVAGSMPATGAIAGNTAVSP